ncbi:MAG: lipopolysaccharide kinase InaA family protein [Phycisphaerae bacterium]
MPRPLFDTEPIDLAGGWSGLVLTRCQLAAPESETRRSLPAVAPWKTWLHQLVSDPSALSGYAMLKYSKDGVVFRARMTIGDGSLDLICRQSRGHGLRRRLATLFRPSRERRNFHRALALLEADINTALPLALIERRRPRREAWLVTEFVPDLVDLDQVVLQLLPRLEPRRARKVKNAILEATVDLVMRMQQSHLTHRDLKASNILLKHWDGRGGPVSLWVVDLDGLRHRRFISAARRWQPVMRLAASLLSYSAVTRSDYGRFLHAYLPRTGAPRETWRRHFRELAQQANDYARRARRRKNHKLDGYNGHD